MGSTPEENEITQLKRENDSLKRELERYRRFEGLLAEAQAIAHFGVWEWCPEENQVYWSPELYQIFGEIRGNYKPTFENYLTKVHPGDRDRVHQTLLKVLKEGVSFSYDERVFRPDGRMRYLHTWGIVIRNESGKPLRLVGVSQDVTETRQVVERIRWEERVRELILSTVNDILFFIKVHPNDQLQFLSVNDAFLMVTERSYSDVIGKFVQDILLRPSYEVLLAQFKKAAQEKHSVRWDVSADRPAGKKVAEVIITPLFDQEGKCTGLIGSARDITERKEGEEKLQNALSVQRATLEATADGILVTDLEGRIVDYNRRLLEIWKLPESAVYHKTYRDALAAVLNLLEEPQECVRTLDAIFQTPEKDSFEMIRFKDGTVLERYSRPQRVHGKPIGRVFSYRDVTVRMKYERELKENEARKSAILDSALDSIITIDHEGKVREFNSAAEIQFGYDSSEVIGKDLANLIIPERLRERHRTGMAHFLSRGEGPLLGKRSELPALRRDGSEFPAEVSIVAVRSEGPPIFTGFVHDISERVKYQEELLNSISLLRATLESTTDGLLVLDAKGKITHFNQKLIEIWKIPDRTLTSYTRGRLLNLMKGQVRHPKTWVRTVFKLQSDPAMQEKGSIEFSDGRVVEWYSVPQRIDDHYAARVWSFRDMTKARVAEREIRIQTGRLRFLADASIIFAQTRLELNPLLKAIVQKVSEFLQEGCVLRLLSSNQINLDIVAYHHVNTEFYSLLEKTLPHGFRLIDDKVVKEVLETRSSVTVSANRAEVLAKVNPKFWGILKQFPVHSWVVVPMRVGGQITGLITFFRYRTGPSYSKEDERFLQDYADRAALAIENARLFDESLKAIRLREEFILTASHELRTPLTPLRAQLQLLLNSIKSGAIVPGKSRKAGEVLSLIETADTYVTRIVDLLEEMLEAMRVASQGVSLSMARTDISGVVRDAIDRMRTELEVAKCKLELSIEPRVIGNWDRHRIEQVVINLLTNAIKFGAGRPIRVSLRGEAGCARLVVRDFGIGVLKEDQSRIFEPFERAVSTQKYGGLGLGLYLTRQIVEAHGGRILVESSPDHGTSFHVELPYAGAVVGTFVRKDFAA